jgi:succinate dehydrogenase hydrophobic anchor subunit
MVFLASRVTEFFWARFTGVVLALLTFYFSMRIMNRLLFVRPTAERNAAAEPNDPPDDDRTP